MAVCSFLIRFSPTFPAYLAAGRPPPSRRRPGVCRYRRREGWRGASEVEGQGVARRASLYKGLPLGAAAAADASPLALCPRAIAAAARKGA